MTLEYQYNSKLDDEIEEQVINDVNSFITMLNSNIAYMYVDAILGEFHHIQDDSVRVLANDNTELKLLENVNATQLIATVEPINEMTVVNDIRPVELATYIRQNDTLLEGMMESFLETSQQVRDEYLSIQESNAEVTASADNFFLM